MTGCVCEDGWNGTNCEYDIDECEGDPSICNDSLLECLNFDGDYMCICKEGFVKSDNGSCFGNIFIYLKVCLRPQKTDLFTYQSDVGMCAKRTPSPCNFYLCRITAY